MLRLILLTTAIAVVLSWAPPPTRRCTEAVRLYSNSNSNSNRRSFMESAALVVATTTGALILPTTSAHALVKGVAPPTKTKKDSKPKCTNVDDCQNMAYIREQEAREEEEQGPPPQITKGGTRYRDIQEGSSDGTSIQQGDEVKLYYKVLKLGKRSYDGISGEGTVVFSRGYGLEDDEKSPGQKSFVTTVGSFQNVAALNDALLSMSIGGMRRFAITPQKGWEKPTKLCDGGPGGQGAGGDLKTDYVIVPTATIVSTESCLDQTKLPFPASYAEQRRMAQRFDQSLIMEIQVVDINKNPSSL